MANKHTREEMTAIVAEILSDQLGVGEEEVTPDIPIVGPKNEPGSLCGDSLDAVEMIMSVEDTRGIKINDDDAQRLLTPGLIVEYLMRRQEDSEYTIPADDPDFPQATKAAAKAAAKEAAIEDGASTADPSTDAEETPAAAEAPEPAAAE